MSEEYFCYRCGQTLIKLTLPLSRRDECPSCMAQVHVCRMCRFYDRTAINQCAEDDAEEVQDKEKVNFCEWFKPDADAFDPQRAALEAQARSDLNAIFSGETAASADNESDPNGAEDLFR